MGMHRDAAYADRPRQVPARALWRAACEDWDEAVALGEQHGYRNAQATVLAPTGHHRPAHGLRHDGHRARLRAREVQEARRRRLLQDREPVGAERARRARLQRDARCRRSSRTSAARTRCSAAPHVNRAHAQGARASRTRTSRRSRRRSPASSSSITRSRRGSSARRRTTPRRSRKEQRSAKRLLACSSTSASRTAEIDEAQRHDHRPHDDRGRAAPASRALRGVRLRQPLRQDGQALPRADGPREDDGGGAAVPLGRDLEDGEPARTRRRSKRSPRSTRRAGGSASRRSRSTATAARRRSRSRRRRSEGDDARRPKPTRRRDSRRSSRDDAPRRALADPATSEPQT